jgi:hypothetical protein
MKTKYFDANGNEIAEHNALDYRGVLRDGCTIRTPMTLRDATARRARITDGTDNPFGLSKPGFRIRTGDTRQSVVDAYEKYDAEICSRWRTDSDIEVQGQRGEDSRSVTRDQAYRDYDQAIAEQWRTPS